MRRSTFLLGLALSLGPLGACKQPQPQPDPIPAVGRLKPSDPFFLEGDPASRRKCQADLDCGAGNLCYPGLFVCFSVYPTTPPMVRVSTVQGADEKPCRAVNIYFAFDSDELVPEALPWLDHNLRCLQSRQVRQLVLEAHCDARGDQEYNVALSRRRGAAVKRYLAEHGLSASIEVRGMGKADPAQEGRTEQDYAWNRRVEFRLP